MPVRRQECRADKGVVLTTTRAHLLTITMLVTTPEAKGPLDLRHQARGPCGPHSKERGLLGLYPRVRDLWDLRLLGAQTAEQH